MIIANSRKFIFIHLYKTAGNSISTSLEPILDWNDIVCGGTEFGENIDRCYKSKFGIFKHSPAKQVKAVVGNKIWDEYFTFSFVRNPFTRTLSNYNYFRNLSKEQGKNRFLRIIGKHKQLWKWSAVKAFLSTRNFSEFIRHEDFVHNSIAGRSMYDLLSEDGLIIVDFVGRFENLNNDFDYICARLKTPPLKLLKINVNKEKADINKYYRNQADIDYIYELYNKDFVHFGYEKMSRGKE